eukprot:symbB.v1.2.023917.t1/scaffold2226.1/size85309/1
MEIDIRLATPWLGTLPLDAGGVQEEVANTTLQTLRSELKRGKGEVPTLLGVVETVADHFLSWYSKDHFISPFRDILTNNRRQNASSSVWWQSGPDAWMFSSQEFAAKLLKLGRAERRVLREQASQDDLSDARRLGFWNSTVVRVKMSEYLCALAYKEAVQLIREELEPSNVMAERPLQCSPAACLVQFPLHFVWLCNLISDQLLTL